MSFNENNHPLLFGLTIRTTGQVALYRSGDLLLNLN